MRRYVLLCRAARWASSTTMSPNSFGWNFPMRFSCSESFEATTILLMPYCHHPRWVVAWACVSPISISGSEPVTARIFSAAW